jgi:hypothetical protein
MAIKKNASNIAGIKIGIKSAKLFFICGKSFSNLFSFCHSCISSIDSCNGVLGCLGTVIVRVFVNSFTLETGKRTPDC